MKKSISELKLKLAVLLAGAVLFLGLPFAVFLFDGDTVAVVRAENETAEDSNENAEDTSDADADKGSESDPSDNSTNSEGESAPPPLSDSNPDTGDSGNKADNEDDKKDDESEGEKSDSSTDSEDKDDTEKPVVKPEPPICICNKTCDSKSIDRDCKVCSADYHSCEYVTPVLKISISVPEGWFKKNVDVTFDVEDIKKSGNFEIKTVMAKIGQSGSWVDVTDDMKLEITENCSVYVQVTDQKDKVYERSRRIECFDRIKPNLNASISDGLLTVLAEDNDSGVDVIFINGFEFTDITNGTLNVRLQKFDASYENFSIKAMDKAGNVSDVYKTKNPYYKNPEDKEDEDKSGELPQDAKPTQPTTATAVVTEHTEVDSEGKTISETHPTNQTTAAASAQDEKLAALREADKEADQEKESETGTDEDEEIKGKTFYTIQTASEKVFYLIIDRDGDDEMVYFLTEISENDLLNVTSDNSQTLPRNSAALESAIPVRDADPEEEPEPETVEESEDPEEETEPEVVEEEPVKEKKGLGINPIIIVFVIGAVGAAYYLKIVKKKKEDFVEDEDEESDEEEIYEIEDDEPEKSEDDTFIDGGDDYNVDVNEETDDYDIDIDDEDTGEYDGISDDEEEV